MKGWVGLVIAVIAIRNSLAYKTCEDLTIPLVGSENRTHTDSSFANGSDTDSISAAVKPILNPLDVLS